VPVRESALGQGLVVQAQRHQGRARGPPRCLCPQRLGHRRQVGRSGQGQAVQGGGVPDRVQVGVAQARHDHPVEVTLRQTGPP